MKLSLTVTHVVLQKKEKRLPLFASEVLAADRKGKHQSTTSQKKKTNPEPDSEQAAASAGSTSVPDMITYLEQRETELKRKEQMLRQKEEYLTQMQQEVEKKLKGLIDIQKEILAYRSEKAEVQNNKIRSLTKIYGSMKPKEAAKLMENLDEPLVVAVIATMNPNEAASILANMDVKKAAKISESLSRR